MVFQEGKGTAQQFFGGAVTSKARKVLTLSYWQKNISLEFTFCTMEYSYKSMFYQ